MPKDQLKYDDEIDLLDLLETLWDGKWLISSLLVLVTLIGFGYTQVTQPKYDVTVSYNANNIICGKKQECMESLLTGLINNSWTIDKKSSRLSLSTTTPLDVNEYEAQLERANEVYTNKVYTDSKNEVALIRVEIPEYLWDAEFSYRRILPHVKIIGRIDAGESALTSFAVSVLKTSPNVRKKLAFSAILGGLIGIVVVFIRSLIRKRKKQLAKA